MKKVVIKSSRHKTYETRRDEKSRGNSRSDRMGRTENKARQDKTGTAEQNLGPSLSPESLREGLRSNGKKLRESPSNTYHITNEVAMTQTDGFLILPLRGETPPLPPSLPRGRRGRSGGRAGSDRAAPSPSGRLRERSGGARVILCVNMCHRCVPCI